MTIQAITENRVYKQVLSDSCGGVMYDVDNQGKYDATDVLALWNSLDACEREMAGGIMKGVIEFLKGN